MTVTARSWVVVTTDGFATNSTREVYDCGILAIDADNIVRMSSGTAARVMHLLLTGVALSGFCSDRSCTDITIGTWIRVNVTTLLKIFMG